MLTAAKSEDDEEEVVTIILLIQFFTRDYSDESVQCALGGNV